MHWEFELGNMYLLLQGKKNPGTDPQSVKLFLGQVMEAKEMQIDRLWSYLGLFFLSIINIVSWVAA
jgi:hypothetical protein